MMTKTNRLLPAKPRVTRGSGTGCHLAELPLASARLPQKSFFHFRFSAKKPTLDAGLGSLFIPKSHLPLHSLFKYTSKLF